MQIKAEKNIKSASTLPEGFGWQGNNTVWKHNVQKQQSAENDKYVNKIKFVFLIFN